MISSASPSSSTTSAPRLTVAQSTPASSGGSAFISFVGILPVATPLPKVPSVSASKAPMARAHRSFDGDMTTMVGRSISERSKCAANAGWHVASTHENASGPPALRFLNPVSICSCDSLLTFSLPPSMSAIAQRPPLLVHSSSNVSAESSGMGPRSLFGLGVGSGLGGASPPLAPSSASRISTNCPTKLAMLPYENLPCICGVNCIPCSCMPPSFESAASAPNMTSSAGAFCTLKRGISVAGSMAKPSFPSNVSEIERKSGGTSLFSEKRRQMALVCDVERAPPIHASTVEAERRSTRLSGSESSAAFFASATASAANALALAFDLAPVPKGSATTEPGEALRRGARDEGATPTRACPKSASASSSASAVDVGASDSDTKSTHASCEGSTSLLKTASSITSAPPWSAAAPSSLGAGAACSSRKARSDCGLSSPVKSRCSPSGCKR
mmetsp:Transcript_31542/g.68976  ORF Transcript_31542/g.68976 Transcript_31542/m.68976 type:complete len:445 (-) Transcript_31542:342-1676(-)